MDALCRLALNIAYRLLLVYWFVFRPTEYGVYVAVWCHGRILLIRNSYKPHYTLPSGSRRRREEPAAAAVRELRQEVGIDLETDRLDRVGEFLSRQEYKRDYSVVFEVDVAPEPEITIDRREVVEAQFVAFEAAQKKPVPNVVEQYFAWKAGPAESRSQRAGEP